MKKLSKELRKKYIKGILIIFSITILVWLIHPNFKIIINHSESLTIHFAVIKKGKIPVQKDDIFVFSVAENPHYKMKNINFIKLLGGKAGDKIVVDADEVYIGDKLIGKAKKTSLKGNDLTIISDGTIPPNKFFAYTPHKDSFDSRYKDLGLIDEKDIIGTAIFAF